MKNEHTYIIYIVQYKDWSYYIGITNNLERRLWEHNTGYDESCYTHSRRPVELIYFEIFADGNEAIAEKNKLRVGQEKRNKHQLLGVLRS